MSSPLPVVSARRWRTRRSAAVAGIAFAVLLLTAMTLMRLALGDDDPRTLQLEADRQRLIRVGLQLVPFAGIAFLWHMNAVRLLIAARTPSPSAMPYGLQLVSGVLFVALLFAGTAAAGAVALLKDLSSAPLPSVDVMRGLLGVGYGMVFVYAVRGAGMYAITTTTLLASAGLLPRWLAVIGYLLAAFLLVSTALNPVVMLLFPAWALLVGVVVFLRSGHLGATVPPEKELTA